jgi:hypothetical protein
MKKAISVLFALTILIVGCAPSAEDLAKQTSVAATSTASIWTATPAPTSTPSFPAYSEIVKTYPVGTELSCTDAVVSKVTEDGKFVFTDKTKQLCPGKSRLTVAAGGTFTFAGNNFKAFGAKITLLNAATINGKSFPSNSLLTVDKDKNWIQVSSWN